MSTSMSITLPGVAILTADATGAQYSRWRRGLKAAFEAKGLWEYCDGTRPMPMPASGPNFFSPVVKSNPQPELLDERKAWMKKDREIKRDIFLSISDDIKLEVFEVGPPLPPSAMKASEMIEALDQKFQSFKFEDYHHAFCHFLNLHIDQYPSVEEFNKEFQATLEDLLDHGYPLDNVQACSAYFSKLRCTQNPWVADRLKEWDTLDTAPQLANLMKECPPWTIIRPLTTKGATAPQQQADAPSDNEQLIGTPSLKADDASDSNSDISTPSLSGTSSASHSRNSSTNTVAHVRKASSDSPFTQEITVHASMEDLTDIKSFPLPIRSIPKGPTSAPMRLSMQQPLSKPDIQALPKMLAPPVNRPLPPIPGNNTAEVRSRSVSPQPTTVPIIKSPVPPSRPHTPAGRKSPTQDQAKVHPALRSRASSTSLARQPSVRHAKSPRLSPPPPPELQRPRSSSGTYALSAPRTTPDLTERPSTSRSPPKSNPFSKSPPLRRIDSTSSSVISLPLQGVPEHQDTVISGNISTTTTTTGLGLQFGPSEEQVAADTVRFSSSPPRNLMSRLSSELNDDDRRYKKRSWSIKAKLNAKRYEVKEII
ncbi:hypothetical protein BU24DRAFT_116240 [Aaosphaeria arxii CBS 175.79]|uniref:Retrotransposon Copia-like N-terminal domain-containing protein n=1 Tax=Aaosphaeria arxii CBS 175.79 TaxID=1450172 RepID=A0A6A5Y3B7_9PLEO|nr:uncharacterized protein BU24DRAFT_116240 [Aaosphaeria arxii CBS 175.79]KAF2019300.1 hypothetical protein BU24DRAFT_116240 [Aaosphaeria arxii CBS 175.79]